MTQIKVIVTETAASLEICVNQFLFLLQRPGTGRLSEPVDIQAIPSADPSKLYSCLIATIQYVDD